MGLSTLYCFILNLMQTISLLPTVVWVFYSSYSSLWLVQKRKECCLLPLELNDSYVLRRQEKYGTCSISANKTRKKMVGPLVDHLILASAQHRNPFQSTLHMRGHCMSTSTLRMTGDLLLIYRHDTDIKLESFAPLT